MAQGESAVLNILKLCVGAELVEDLARLAGHPSFHSSRWRALPCHTDVAPPRGRGAGGGSLYWVIKGVILCRQRILALDRVEGADGILRCGLVMDPEIIRTEAAPRRPFQGWRYIDPGDCPPDRRTSSRNEVALPPQMAIALAELGLR